MNKILEIILISSLTVSTFAGFETKEESKAKEMAERLSETKKYVDSMIGKIAWYNSQGCFSDSIYADKDKMSYKDTVYATDDKYVPVKFLEADIFQDIYQDYITFKVQIDSKDTGYIKAASASKIEIKDNSYSCFQAHNPDNKQEYKLDRSNLNKEQNNILFGWDVSCKKDAFNGKKVFSISKGKLMVLLLDGRYAVSVGRNHYPGTTSAIKIDDNVAYYGKEGLINTMYANLIVKQMKEGKKAVVRYQEWPYKYNQDIEVDLTDFTKRLNEMLEQYKKL